VDDFFLANTLIYYSLTWSSGKNASRLTFESTLDGNGKQQKEQSCAVF
jgi:hypothetical protein